MAFMRTFKMSSQKQGLVLGICGLFLLFACKEEKKKHPQPLPTYQTEVSKELTALNDSILDDPNSAYLYHQRAKYFIKTKDLQSALNDMDRVLKLDSSKAAYYITLSDIHFAKRNPKQTKLDLEKALKKEPNDPEALLRNAEFYLYLKDHPKSIQLINTALKVNKYNAKAYFMKGVCYKEMRDTAKAISSFQTTVEQDPEYYHAYMELGILYGARKNNLAVGYYENALRIDPKSTEALYGLAMYYQEIKELNKAIETYTAIIDIDPQYANAYYNLGYIHFEELKMYHESIKYFSKAFEANPKYAEAVYMRGLCFETLGDIGRAASEYQLALKIRTNYQMAIDGLNRVKQ
jgi:tetratricopeptide (TPR) repeat protein